MGSKHNKKRYFIDFDRSKIVSNNSPFFDSQQILKNHAVHRAESEQNLNPKNNNGTLSIEDIFHRSNF